MAAWATFLMTALLAASQIRAGECRTIQLKPAPPIFNTPIFDEAGDKLLLVDILAGGIDVYSLSGDRERTIKKPDFSRPNTIASTPSGYLVRDGGDRFVAMNRELVPTRSFEMSATGPNAFDGAPFQWTPIDRGVLAYGDLRLGTQPWKTGVFRVVSGQPPQFLKNMPGGAAREPYLYEGKYVATIGSREYVLSFSPDYGLFEIDGKNVRLLTGLPPGFGALPHLPQSHGRSSMPLLYAALSRTTSVSSLIVVEERPYILMRRFENGQRTWFLAEYDPAKQKTVAILELPTSADHVEIAAGKKWLAVIGKGRFLPDERFTPGNVTLIPMSALRALHAAGGSVESPRKPCHAVGG